MEKYVIRKVTEIGGFPVLIQQCGNLFIYVVCINKGFYSASIESVPPFWRKHTEQEILEATNLSLTAAQTTIEQYLKTKK